MDRLDGNALAGALADVLGFDPTAASGRCSGCGRHAPLATAAASVSAMGRVLRCPGCDHVLAVLVEAGARRFVSFRGLSALEIPVADP